MSDLTIVIELPSEAQRLLAENRVDLVSALREQNLDVRRAANPTAVPTSMGGKEAMLTILAIGVTTTLIATAVSKILDALGRNKKVLVKEYELRSAVDDSGAPLRDASSGQPVLYWSEKNRLVEATQITQDKSTTSFEAGAGPLLLKFMHDSNK